MSTSPARPAWSLARSVNLTSAAFAGPAILLALQVVRYVLAPVDERVTLVPDDGFYYLGLARHYAESGAWTFDGGVSRTTGFHLLHAYVCALGYWLFPGMAIAQRMALYAVLGAALSLAALWFLVRILDRHFGRPAVLGAALVATSANFLLQPLGLMEWPYVVLFGALCLWAIVERRPWLALAAALLGTLARSDFPGVAAAAAAAGAVVLWRRGDKRLLHDALHALAGAAVGLGVVVAHTYFETGELLQSSVRIKAHWGAIRGHDPRLAAEIFAWTGAPGHLLLEEGGRSFKAFVLAHAALIAAAAALRRIAPRAPGPGDRAADEGRQGAAARLFLVAFAALAAAGYVAVYARNTAAIQPWYSAHFVLPAAILYALILRGLRWRNDTIIVPALVALLAAQSFRAAARPPFPAQRFHAAAGLWLAEHAPPGRVAAWNAGILGYFAGGRVVNIDGLVNDDLVDDVVRGELRCYLLRADIRYIMDWETMFERRYPRYGGYDDGVLRRSLAPRYVVPGTERGEHGFHHLTLFEIDRAALERAGLCGG